jgi:hypothetical protein
VAQNPDANDRRGVTTAAAERHDCMHTTLDGSALRRAALVAPGYVDRSRPGQRESPATGLVRAGETVDIMSPLAGQ